VAGRIDDLGAVIPNAGDLGKNGNAFLALQVTAIHYAVLNDLILSVQAGLFEDSIDQRGFSVVYMRNDAYVPS